MAMRELPVPDEGDIIEKIVLKGSDENGAAFMKVYSGALVTSTSMGANQSNVIPFPSAGIPPGQQMSLGEFKMDSVTSGPAVPPMHWDTHVTSDNTYVGGAPNWTPGVVPQTPGWIPSQVEPLTGVDFDFLQPPHQAAWDSCKTFGHRVEAESLVQDINGNVSGRCTVCQVPVCLPRVPGAFSAERAGIFVGRAMSIEEEEDISQLLAELNVLQEELEADQKRLRRAQEMIDLARSVAQRAAVEELTGERS